MDADMMRRIKMKNDLLIARANEEALVRMMEDTDNPCSGDSRGFPASMSREAFIQTWKDRKGMGT